MEHFSALIKFTLVFVVAAAQNLNAQNHAAFPAPQRHVAITFDDLPATSRREVAALTKLTTKLLASITSNEIPAIGFVNESKLLDNGKLDERRVALLQMWIDAGLELGNHTFSHPDLNRTPLATFQQDVIRGEEATKRLLQAQGKTLRYFRHPFLHTGNDLETKRRFEEFLAQRGYRIAPVTIDNSEWIFARAYENAITGGDPKMQQQIADAYIPYMNSKFEYFEKASIALL